MPRLTSNETPINPYRIIWDFMHTVDRTKTILTHDSGHPRDQTIPFYEAIVPRGYIGWGNSSQLGYSIGVAMGVKLGAKDKTVATIMGDAAIGMAGMDIETAARHNIPILIIVLNNHVLSGYSALIIPWPLRSTPSPISTASTPTWPGLLGSYSERVEDPAEIVPAIKRAQAAMDAGQPALLEFMTKEENTLSHHTR